MKNPNVKILVIAGALILLVLLAAAVMPMLSSAPKDGAVSDTITITPSIPEATADTQAYLRVQVGGDVWPLIPLTEGEYTITQPNGARNVVRTTAAGAVMQFSTCENQHCVQQLEVNLNNRATRVMGSLIVCLPNQVVLELLDAGEVQ